MRHLVDIVSSIFKCFSPIYSAMFNIGHLQQLLTIFLHLAMFLECAVPLGYLSLCKYYSALSEKCKRE
jgi:hypothetical protein